MEKVKNPRGRCVVSFPEEEGYQFFLPGEFAPTLQGPPGIFFIIRWCNIKSQMKPSGWFYMVLLWKFWPGRKKEWGYQAHSRVGVNVIFLERGLLILARREDVSHPPCPPVHKHPCTFIPWWFSYKIYVQRFICFNDKTMTIVQILWWLRSFFLYFCNHT